MTLLDLSSSPSPYPRHRRFVFLTTRFYLVKSSAPNRGGETTAEWKLEELGEVGAGGCEGGGTMEKKGVGVIFLDTFDTERVIRMPRKYLSEIPGEAGSSQSAK